MEEGKYAKTLAKIQVTEIFHMQDMGRNVLPKFKEICMEDTQKLRNSSVVYHKTKNPFGAKICMKISFQLLLIHH